MSPYKKLQKSFETLHLSEKYMQENGLNINSYKKVDGAENCFLSLWIPSYYSPDSLSVLDVEALNLNSVIMITQL